MSADAGNTARTEALMALEHEIAVLLRRIRRVIHERAQLVHPELNSSAYVMLGALREGGAQRASALADTFRLDKGAVSRLVHQLLELGLIERRADPDDGRASLLHLTDLGRRRLDAAGDRRRDHVLERLADWTPQELGELAASLARYNEALADVGE